MLTFVTVQTLNIFGDNRNVTLSYSSKNDMVTLLGNLPHGTKIIINQKLVDDLQEIVNIQKKKKTKIKKRIIK